MWCGRITRSLKKTCEIETNLQSRESDGKEFGTIQSSGSSKVGQEKHKPKLVSKKNVPNHLNQLMSIDAAHLYLNCLEYMHPV